MLAIGLDWPNLILNLLGTALLLVVAGLILVILNRQRRDLADSRRLLRHLAEYAAATEHDLRRTRHAVKDLAAASNLRSSVEALEAFPDFLPLSPPRRELVEQEDRAQ